MRKGFKQFELGKGGRDNGLDVTAYSSCGSVKTGCCPNTRIWFCLNIVQTCDGLSSLCLWKCRSTEDNGALPFSDLPIISSCLVSSKLLNTHIPLKHIKTIISYYIPSIDMTIICFLVISQGLVNLLGFCMLKNILKTGRCWGLSPWKSHGNPNSY